MSAFGRPHILLIDNHDSFTYNIVALLALAGCEVTVEQAENILAAEIYRYPWAGIVIGSGPGHPSYLVEVLPPLIPPALSVPLLGICLGHQYIVQIFGGRVEPMERPYFGLQKRILHNGTGIFRHLPNPLPVGVYHALHASLVPSSLEVVARDKEGHCMAVRHVEYPIWGLQFHPDSILTPHGQLLMQAWVHLVASLSAKNV
ncbi:MAG: aminodeoxychorismate/anthranilate synthase component II [Bacteroidia bacterium]